MRGLFIDTVKKTLWIFSDSAIFQYHVTRESRYQSLSTKTIFNHYWTKGNSDHSFSSSVFNPFTLKSDQYLISPYNITPWITHESQKNEGNVHQIKKPKNVKTNSPCQHLRNSIETSKEIIHTDVRVNTVLMQQSKHLHLFL